MEKESILTTEDESRKSWKKPLNSPAKNLRFFGDTDQDSNASHTAVSKSKSHPLHGTLRKTTSNSTGVDETDTALNAKSYSLSNLHREEKDPSPKSKFYKRNLKNISENHSNSETGSQLERKGKKPPISPYDRSRSHSSSKTLKPERRNDNSSDIRRTDRGSASDVRRADRGSSSDVRRTDRGSSSDVRRTDRGSSSELRGKPEVNRDLK